MLHLLHEALPYPTIRTCAASHPPTDTMDLQRLNTATRHAGWALAGEVKTTTEYILDYAVPRAEEKLSAIADPEVLKTCLEKDRLTSGYFAPGECSRFCNL